MAESGDKTIEAIVTRQRRENAHHARALAERIARAEEFIKSVPSALLTLDPNLRRIVLFGSLAAGKVRRIGFDIDLAVDSDHYLKIVDWSFHQPFSIDVVDLGAVDDDFAGQIIRGGRTLYEAQR